MVDIFITQEVCGGGPKVCPARICGAEEGFFEAHYKKIAAQKAAAALLEQENAAKVEAEKEAERDGDNSGDDQQLAVLNSQLVLDKKMEEPKIQDVMEDSEVNANKHSSTAVAEIRTEEAKVEITGNEVSLERSVNRRNLINQLDILENQETFSGSEGSGTPLMERPLLKQNSVAIEDVSTATSKKKSGLSSLKSSIQRKTWKVPSTPSKPVTPHCKKENNVIQKHNNEQSSAAKKTESSVLAPISFRTPKACRTPLRTPILASTKGVSNYPAATPRSENRRLKTPIDPSAPGRKTTGPKWHILSAVCSKSLTACRNRLQSPTLSTPFILRTEERAAKRKQARIFPFIILPKLEEKFNANEMQNAQLQKTLKEKAGNEFRKLGCGFCFKARPLPDFYKERETSVNQIKKTPARAQPAVLGRSISNKTTGTISMPPPPPPPTSLPKNRVSKNLSKKIVLNPSKSLASSLPERTTHENRSPNIQS
ncbi:UNVERIFIED_CONTAM: hypothetical protein Scaly_0022700 [Sesamum calycinum]|uniref:TPX2 C-terminal domain-containing protein n=1 Tax=Sesamum calycinum TaxID=2727403 RepID=A0AAW2STL9_9LAMI